MRVASAAAAGSNTARAKFARFLSKNVQIAGLELRLQQESKELEQGSKDLEQKNKELEQKNKELEQKSTELEERLSRNTREP